MCRPELFGQFSENTNSAYVSGHRYGRNDLHKNEENSLGYEKRASVRLLLNFLSLDIASLMVVKFPGDFMGNGRVLLSGGLPASKVFGVILWDGRSPCSVVVDVFCFVFQPQVSHQMWYSSVEPWGGATGQPEIWLKIGA